MQPGEPDRAGEHRRRQRADRRHRDHELPRLPDARRGDAGPRRLARLAARHPAARSPSRSGRSTASTSPPRPPRPRRARPRHHAAWRAPRSSTTTTNAAAARAVARHRPRPHRPADPAPDRGAAGRCRRRRPRRPRRPACRRRSAAPASTITGLDVAAAVAWPTPPSSAASRSWRWSSSRRCCASSSPPAAPWRATATWSRCSISSAPRTASSPASSSATSCFSACAAGWSARRGRGVPVRAPGLRRRPVDGVGRDRQVVGAVRAFRRRADRLFRRARHRLPDRGHDRADLAPHRLPLPGGRRTDAALQADPRRPFLLRYPNHDERAPCTDDAGVPRRAEPSRATRRGRPAVLRLRVAGAVVVGVASVSSPSPTWSARRRRRSIRAPTGSSSSPAARRGSTAPSQLLAEGRADRLLISGVNPSVGRRRSPRPSGGDSDALSTAASISTTPATRSATPPRRAMGDEQGFSSLIVVTSDYHMPRSMAELADAMPGVGSSPFRCRAPSCTSTMVARSETFSLLVREYGKIPRCRGAPAPPRRADSAGAAAASDLLILRSALFTAAFFMATAILVIGGCRSFSSCRKARRSASRRPGRACRCFSSACSPASASRSGTREHPGRRGADRGQAPVGVRNLRAAAAPGLPDHRHEDRAPALPIFGQYSVNVAA